MKAHNCTIITTDLLASNPLVNFVSQEIYTDTEDFIFAGWLRYMAIKADYPNARYIPDQKCVMVFIGKTLVYFSQLQFIGEEVIIPDEE